MDNKVKVGQKYKDEGSTIYTIIGISQKKDYDDCLSYFVEATDSTGDIWYTVLYEGHMNEVELIK